MNEQKTKESMVGSLVQINALHDRMHKRIGVLRERDGNRYVVEVEGVRYAFYGHSVVRAVVAH